MRQFNDEELAALDRIVERLEAWLDYGGNDAAEVSLFEEELLLMREIVEGKVTGA